MSVKRIVVEFSDQVMIVRQMPEVVARILWVANGGRSFEAWIEKRGAWLERGAPVSSVTYYKPFFGDRKSISLFSPVTGRLLYRNDGLGTTDHSDPSDRSGDFLVLETPEGAPLPKDCEAVYGPLCDTVWEKRGSLLASSDDRVRGVSEKTLRTALDSARSSKPVFLPRKGGYYQDCIDDLRGQWT